MSLLCYRWDSICIISVAAEFLDNVGYILFSVELAVPQ